MLIPLTSRESQFCLFLGRRLQVAARVKTSWWVAGTVHFTWVCGLDMMHHKPNMHLWRGVAMQKGVLASATVPCIQLSIRVSIAYCAKTSDCQLEQPWNRRASGSWKVRKTFESLSLCTLFGLLICVKPCRIPPMTLWLLNWAWIGACQPAATDWSTTLSNLAPVVETDPSWATLQWKSKRSHAMVLLDSLKPRFPAEWVLCPFQEKVAAAEAVFGLSYSNHGELDPCHRAGRYRRSRNLRSSACSGAPLLVFLSKRDQTMPAPRPRSPPASSCSKEWAPKACP